MQPVIEFFFFNSLVIWNLQHIYLMLIGIEREEGINYDKCNKWQKKEEMNYKFKFHEFKEYLVSLCFQKLEVNAYRERESNIYNQD